MALDAAQQQDYLRKALAQQQLYAYWRAAGDLARARLAMDVANWFYQQLGAPLYAPADDRGYGPLPTDPATASAAAAALPLDAGEPTLPPGLAGQLGAGSRGANVVQYLATKQPAPPGRGAQDFGSLYDYCLYYPEDPICYTGGQYGSGGSGYCDVFPNDPECGGYYAGGGGSVTTVVNITNETVVINQQGLTLGDVASRIKGAVSSATAAVVGAVDAALKNAIGGIQAAISAIGKELISIFSKLARLAGYLLKVLQTILLDIVHGLVRAVQAIGKMLSDVFKNGLLPALHALQKIRDRLIEIYQRFLRPVLIVIQNLRKVLAILSVFHVKFAMKLDAALADIERKLTAPLFYLLRFTNQIANWMNLILTARYLLQKPLFLNSLQAYMGSALALQINAMVKPIDPAAIAARLAADPIPSPAQSDAGLKDFLQHGGGTFSAAIARQSAQLDVYLTQGF